jgi:hypothetical protein
LTLLVEKGTFTKRTTASPGTQTVNLVDSTLTPKVIWLWTSGQTTSNGTYEDHMLWSFGWSDTVNDVCESARWHETNENEAYVMRNDAIISIMSMTAGSEVSRADVSAVAAGSFTLNWSVQSDTNAMVVHYMVAGGTDITNVSAFQSTMQNTSTGNHSWNGTGTTFTPEFAMTMAMQDVTSLAINTISNIVDNSQISVGAATGTSNQFVVVGREETSTTSDASMHFWNNICIGSINPTSGAFAYGGPFVSFNNAAGGGITVNITTAASNVNPVAFLLIKGGKWDVKTFQQPAATGTQNVTLTDSTVTPKLVGLIGIGSATANANVANHYIGIGGSDGTREGNCWNGDTALLGTWQTARSTDTGKVYRQGGAPAATASSTSTVAECNLTSMSTAGQFTLNWTTADATQRQTAFWMVGEVVTGAQFNRTASDTITISDASTTRIVSALRVPSTDSSTITDSSLTRMISATRAPGTDTATVVDSSLTRSKTWPRVPSTDSSTITDSSLVRMLSATRAPSTDTLTTGESSTRMLSAVRLPTSDSTAVADVSITQAKAYTRTPSDTTAVVDSALTRLLSARRTGSDTTGTSESLIRILSAFRVPGSDNTTVADVSTLRIRSLTRAPSTDTATVVDSSLTRLLQAARTSQDTVVISDASLTRLKSALRIVTADTISLSESITRTTSQSLVRTTSDNTAVTDGTLSRFLSATRVPSLDTVVIADSSIIRRLQLVRTVGPDTIVLSESISSALTTAGVFSRSTSDTVAVVDSSLIRLLSSTRTASDTSSVSESLARFVSRARSPTTDNISIVDVSINRIRSLSRTPTQDTMNIVEASLIRLLSLARNATDTTIITEVQSAIAHSRALLETVNVTEPLLQRIVSASRSLNDIVNISEAVFIQTYHKFVFDTVVVSEQLFSIRQSLTGAVTYATPDEVRPLLGNLGAQKANEPIELAIDAAFDEINTKTNRIPPNEWKDTDHNFGIIKKLTRYIAAKEVAIGIKDFDTKPFDLEIEHLFNDLLTYDTTSDATQDIVGSSEDVTFALNEGGLIWSTRYPNLRKRSGSENSTTINPDT